jgi:hypothetical protein
MVDNFADYSVWIAVAIKKQKIYVINVTCTRVDFPTLMQAAIQAYQQYNPH